MNSDLIELLQLLNSHKVKYLVIGGQAVSLHSEPRYTKDFDLWVGADKCNARRLYTVIREFGAPTDAISPEDLATPGTIFIFGLEPNRFDISNRVKGATFENSYKRRLRVALNDVSVNFVSLDDLIKIKRATGRPQDLIDLKNLLQTKALTKALGAAKTKRSVKRAVDTTIQRVSRRTSVK